MKNREIARTLIDMALTYPDLRKKDVEVQISVLEILVEEAKAILNGPAAMRMDISDESREPLNRDDVAKLLDADLCYGLKRHKELRKDNNADDGTDPSRYADPIVEGQ